VVDLRRERHGGGISSRSHVLKISDVTSLSIVVPATNDPVTLEECISSIARASDPPEEVLVITSPPNIGPAAARNIGAEQATGDVLVFIDSDVAVHPDVFGQIRAALSGDPSLTALFGSYDSDPSAGGLVSDFRNLLHHHVHQAAAGPAQTFWAGLGAVRRRDFLAVGGFDAQRFPRPSVEDIDLGMRLVDRGCRIVLDPQLQGKHLKRWTLVEMIRTDFSARGLPWVALLLRRGSDSTALNLGWRHRVTAATSVALVAALLGRRLRLSAALITLNLVLNQPFYRLLLRQRGVAAVVAAMPLHVVHHLVGAAAVPVAIRHHYFARRSHDDGRTA
jgi:GT2 family glycosyltransferase